LTGVDRTLRQFVQVKTLLRNRLQSRSRHAGQCDAVVVAEFDHCVGRYGGDAKMLTARGSPPALNDRFNDG